MYIKIRYLINLECINNNYNIKDKKISNNIKI